MAETLQEVFELLERTLPAATLARMRDGSEADMIDHHHGVGMWLRNQWRGGDSLPRELRGLHIHMDDLSGIVLEGFWCHLRGLQLSFDELLTRYRANQKRWMEQPWTLVTESRLARASADLRIGSDTETHISLKCEATFDGERRRWCARAAGGPGDGPGAFVVWADDRSVAILATFARRLGVERKLRDALDENLVEDSSRRS